MSAQPTTNDPRVSLLTSSSSLDIKHMRQEFGGEVSTVEVYALRNPDIEQCELQLDDHMADMISELNSDEVSNVAGELQAELRASVNSHDAVHQNVLEPVGIATYLPQITSASPDRREVTLHALENILLMAAEMRVSCVEMVCGRVAERCNGSEDGNRCGSVLYQHRESEAYPTVKFDLLKSGLTRLRHFAQEYMEEHPKSPPLAVALEVEPGPLYVLNDLKEAKKILDGTANDDYMISHENCSYNFVGLNVDIGHMLICHPRNRHVLKELGIKGSRIYNFHISDNAELHFADLVPGTIHSIHPKTPGSFSDWLRCFLCLCKRTDNPVFTRNVSIELEGCASPQWAHQAIRNTRYMLAELFSTHDSDIEECRKDCSVINS